MLRKKISKFGMATAGVAVGAIMAISPVFAQGTSTTTAGDTLLADILAAAQKAGLTAEQTKELLELAGEFTIVETAPTTEVDQDVDEDQDEDVDDDTGAAAEATTEKEKETTKHTVTTTAPKSGEESKGDD